MSHPYAGAKRRSLKARIVAALDLGFEGKPYRLVPTPSRVVLAGSIHELIATSDDTWPGDGPVREVGIIGFVEFTLGGVIVPGDALVIAGRSVGTVAGFDESHAPNHLNIFIRTAERVTGASLALDLEDELLFVPFTGAHSPAL